jgi:hypothetical protein
VPRSCLSCHPSHFLVSPRAVENLAGILRPMMSWDPREAKGLLHGLCPPLRVGRGERLEDRMLGPKYPDTYPWQPDGPGNEPTPGERGEGGAYLTVAHGTHGRTTERDPKPGGRARQAPPAETAPPSPPVQPTAGSQPTSTKWHIWAGARVVLFEAFWRRLRGCGWGWGWRPGVTGGLGQFDESVRGSWRRGVCGGRCCCV